MNKKVKVLILKKKKKRKQFNIIIIVYYTFGTKLYVNFVKCTTISTQNSKFIVIKYYKYLFSLGVRVHFKDNIFIFTIRVILIDNWTEMKIWNLKFTPLLLKQKWIQILKPAIELVCLPFNCLIYKPDILKLRSFISPRGH